MLSAESASGRYPVEAVAMMNRIIVEVEGDPYYRTVIDASHTEPAHTIADAISCSLRETSRLLPVTAIVTFTRSGYTSLRAARERPSATVVSLTPNAGIARRLALVWGVHSVHTEGIRDIADMIAKALARQRRAVREAGRLHRDRAGMPFGSARTTNLLHVMEVPREAQRRCVMRPQA